jgi:hypothetical protein
VLTLKSTALDLLGKGKVTFADAAGIAKLSLWEFADLVKQQNVEWVRFKPKEVEKEFKETLIKQNRKEEIQQVAESIKNLRVESKTEWDGAKEIRKWRDAEK